MYLTKHQKRNENYRDVSVKKVFRYRKNLFRMNVKPFAYKQNPNAFAANAFGFIAKAFDFTSMLRSNPNKKKPYKAAGFTGHSYG